MKKLNLKPLNKKELKEISGGGDIAYYVGWLFGNYNRNCHPENPCVG